MIECIIFDLADTLIKGLTGVENILCTVLSCPKEEILGCFRDKNITELLTGDISEDDYLDNIININNWNIEKDYLKKIIRENFTAIEGMPQLITKLSKKFELVLLSNHGREWIEYIEEKYDFLKNFTHRYYSYQLKKNKSDQNIFYEILNKLNRNAMNCIYIDDREENTITAEKCGIKSLVFKGISELKTSLGQYGIEAL